MALFDVTKPMRTRDGRFKAIFVSLRRSNGFIARLEGYAKKPGESELFAFRPNGKLTLTLEESPLDLVNCEGDEKGTP